MKPQKLGLENDQSIKNTKAAQLIKRGLDDFRHYYRLAQGREPAVIHLRAAQFEVLGVKPGYVYERVRLELYQQ